MSPNVEFVLQKRYISLRAGGQITRTETTQTSGRTSKLDRFLSTEETKKES